MRTYKFFRKETQQWEEVSEEIWHWEATYEDGSTLKQFDDEGIFHQFSEIDQTKLAVFKMTSANFPNVYTVLFSDPKMKLIHFYKNCVLNAATEDETRIRFYCFGYEINFGAKKVRVVNVITPDNELISTENPDLIVAG